MLYSLCQFTVYKFSIFYKHVNPNNQPYYYIIIFTQYTKIRNYFFDWKWRGNNSHCLHDRLLKVHSCQTIHNYITKLKVRNKIKHRQKSAKQGNLRHPRVRFQSFADSTSLVIERSKSYPRMSEISLSCTFVGVRFYISHFWDRPVHTFSDVRFSYLALVQDKKITCVLPANACCTVYVNCPPILHAFPF